MKLNELVPLLAKKKRLPEKVFAELFVEATVNATHEEMELFRVVLASSTTSSKRADTYFSVVCVLATANHQYTRRVQEFEKEWMRRRQSP